MLTGSACGKYILVGEHAVVYGCNAVAAPLRTARLEVQISESSEYSIAINGLNLTKELEYWVQDIQKLLKLSPTPIDIHVKSNIPPSSGLGSSAALSVAIIRALKNKLPPDNQAELANYLDEKFHGKPSGLDVHVVAYERFIMFNKADGIEILKQPQRAFTFVIIDSGERSSTVEMVKKVAPNLATNTAVLTQFDDLAFGTKLALERSDFKSLAKNLNLAGGLLADLDLETSLMKKIKILSRENGIAAMKITGAGGGGCLLGLVADKEKFLAGFQKFILPLNPSLQFFMTEL